MEEVTLKALLAEVADDCKGATYRFGNKADVSLMVAADSELVTVSKVSEITLKDGFLSAVGARETLHVPNSRVVGLRSAEHSGEGKPGFLR